MKAALTAASPRPTSSKLLYATYLGGSAPDGAFAVAVDAAAEARRK
jgi:hypothetical protein